MRETKLNLIFIGLCLAFVGMYKACTVDWDLENMFRPAANAPVHMTGYIAETEPIQSVMIKSIPPAVYDAIKQGDTTYSRYITGNYKYVLPVFFGQALPRWETKRELKRLFEQEGYDEYYRKRVIDLGNMWRPNCSNCAQTWINENCGGKICIIHPQKRQAVIIEASNLNKLKVLLEKYKEW